MKKIFLILIFLWLLPEIASAALIANAGTDHTCLVNEPCFLDATNSTPYISIYDYEWDFDNSNEVDYRDCIAAFCFTKYNTVGSYTATLRITDNLSVTATDTVIITVVAPITNNTYYVSKTGNDNNNGSEANPWLTINKAASVAVAGDTVVIKQGVYAENISFTNSGTATAPITYKSYPGDTVTIQTSSGGTALNFSGDRYIIIDGFNLDGNNVGYFGVRDGTNSSNITIRNCKVYDYVNDSDTGAKEGWGVYFNGGSTSHIHTNAVKTYHIIDNCEIYNNEERNIVFWSGNNLILNSNIHHPLAYTLNQWDNVSLNGAGMGTILYGNMIHDNNTSPPGQAHSDGIEIYGAENVLIENNDIYNASTELIMADAAVRPTTDVNRNILFIRNRIWTDDNTDGYVELQLYDSPNVKIFNNIFAGTYDNIRWGTKKGTELTWGQIKNNIFYNCNKGFRKDAGSDNAFLSNNDYYNCGTLTENLDSIVNKSLTKDPLFVDPVNHNYALKLNSPVINNGTFVGLSFISNAPDIGAYEVTVVLDSLPPSAPVGVVVE